MGLDHNMKNHIVMLYDYNIIYFFACQHLFSLFANFFSKNSLFEWGRYSWMWTSSLFPPKSRVPISVLQNNSIFPSFLHLILHSKSSWSPHMTAHFLQPLTGSLLFLCCFLQLCIQIVQMPERTERAGSQSIGSLQLTYNPCIAWIVPSDTAELYEISPYR